MSTTPIGGYRLSQKLHPLSLLAQLTSRRVTGCLRVFTDQAYWSIYLHLGKLTYASCSERAFERLDTHLRRLNQQIPTLNSAAHIQMRMMFENQESTKPQADYQAICWLVEQDYITYTQAAALIDELAKDVLESFLTITEGNYEFNRDCCLDKLPTFCQIDLRLLVEYCQNQLKNRHQHQFHVASQTPISDVMQVTSPPSLVNSFTQTQENSSEGKRFNVGGNSDNQVNRHKSNQIYTVACIDDSPTVLKSIQRFLDDGNFRVVTINDPVKALMQILRSKPDLILLDVEMPNLDGYELCSLLRRHSAFKDIPIVMVTGRTGFIDRAKAKMVRSSGYLTKPFTQSELLKMVFKHIN